MKLNRHTRMAGVAAIGALTLVLAACGSDDAVSQAPGATTPAPEGTDPTEDDNGDDAPALSGQIAGAGASSQEAAMNAWIAEFQNANTGVTVAYDPVGSGGGRTQFLSGGTLFAGSDSPMSESELGQAADRCAGGDAAELPLYISPIAVIFSLDGIDSLNMSPATIARVFNQDITRWDDPEIADANPDVDLPDLAITPVNRSDESGTTDNFTEYLEAAAGDAWPHEASGAWPISGTQSAQGTSGVVQTVTDGQGTIGYADASRAGALGTVAVLVGDDYVPYSPEAAAAVVDASPREEGRPESSLVIELERDTTAAGAYPIVLLAYSMACVQYDDPAEAELVRAFLTYIASEEGQTVAASAAGSAPISDELRQDVMAVVDSIS